MARGSSVSIAWQIFPDRGGLAESLAHDVVDRLQAGIRHRGVANLAVSGGTTPRLFFETLSRQRLAWDRVRITLVDERWVPESDPRSNARNVKTHLVKNRAANAVFRTLYSGSKTPEDGLAKTVQVCGDIAKTLDVAVVGMGLDGHTASLFPRGDTLGAAMDPETDALFLPMRAPHLDESRITMTVPVLINATALFLHIEGSDKRAVLETALQDGPVEDMPIRALVRDAEKTVPVYWAP